MIYEINEGKGFVKEYYYFASKLSFEGEYINGEKNGKGNHMVLNHLKENI